MSLNESLNEEFRYAADSGNLDEVNRLLDLGVDPSAEDNLAIQWASDGGHLVVVNRLLQDPRVDPSANINAALVNAATSGHIAVVERLLQDPRVDPNDDNPKSSDTGDTITEVLDSTLSKNRKLVVINILLRDPRVDPSRNNNCIIKNASSHGYVDIVNRLLQDPRVDPSEKDDEGHDALRYALEDDYEDSNLAVIERLLQDPRIDPTVYSNELLELTDDNSGVRNILINAIDKIKNKERIMTFMMAMNRNKIPIPAVLNEEIFKNLFGSRRKRRSKSRSKRMKRRSKRRSM